MSDWIERQQVAVHCNGRLVGISEIVRLTKTLIILRNGERYRRCDGRRRLDQWTTYHIYPAKQSDFDLLERRNLRYEIEDVIKNKSAMLLLEELREISRIIKTAEERQNDENTSRSS